jgi:hypothetical protein
MKSVAALRAAGFTVAPAKDAVDCTEVVFKKPFFSFNPRFNTTPAEMFKAMEPTDAAPEGGYRIIIAGSHSDSAEIPYEIVLQNDFDRIAFYHRRLEELRAEAAKLENSFAATVKQAIA